MADRTVQILPGGQSAAPFSYLIPPSTSFTLMAVRATFNGSGAAGDFLPCVQLVSDAGVVMAQTIGSAVTAGDSADVTFAPFLRARQSSTPSGGGIQFDTEPQDGGWLFVQTDGPGTTSDGHSISIRDNSGDGILLDSLNYGFGDVEINGKHVTINTNRASTWTIGGTGLTLNAATTTINGDLAASNGGNSVFVTSGLGQAGLSATNLVNIQSGNAVELDGVSVVSHGTTNAELVAGLVGPGTQQSFIDVTASQIELAQNPNTGTSPDRILYRTFDSGDGTHWNHEWYDGNGNVIMSVTWGGAAYVYSINGGTWI